jgi:hypothetical protein
MMVKGKSLGELFFFFRVPQAKETAVQLSID